MLGFGLYYFTYVYYNKNGPRNIFIEARSLLKRNGIKALICDVCMPLYVGGLAVIAIYVLDYFNLNILTDIISTVVGMNGVVLFLRKITNENVSADAEARSLDYK